MLLGYSAEKLEGLAAKFAKILGYSQEQFVALALQALLDEADLDLKVEVKVA